MTYWNGESGRGSNRRESKDTGLRHIESEKLMRPLSRNVKEQLYILGWCSEKQMELKNSNQESKSIKMLFKMMEIENNVYSKFFF